MSQFIDTIGSEDSNTYLLILRAKVIDPDGVELVISSYCNRSEGKWHNITMQLDPEYESIDMYKATAQNYTLTNSNSGIIWDIKFYACDNLGHWNTNETFQSVNRLWSSESLHLPSIDVLVGITVGVAVVIVVVVQRKR